MRRTLVRFGLFCLMSVIFSSISFASSKVVSGLSSTSLNKILRDDLRNYVYAADNSHLFVISTTLDRVIKTISISGPVTGMAINKTSNWLDLAAGGQVTRVDLRTLTVIAHYSLPKLAIYSVAFDNLNNVYVWAYPPAIDGDYPQFGWIYKLNSTGSTVLSTFGAGTALNQQLYQGLLKTDSTGTVLYAGEASESPLSIYSFDISGTSPVYLAGSSFGTLGSNLRDFAVAPDNSQIYLAQGAPYGIQVINASNLSLVQLLNTEPYPSAVALNLSGDSLYGIQSGPGNGDLYEFDESGISLKSTKYSFTNSNAEATDIAIERLGQKAYIVVSDSLSGSPAEIDVVDVNNVVCSSLK